MIGKTVSHYRITRELGAGGMGVVYEAVDLKLDRTVALKFLPSTLTGESKAKARFIHEAKAASSLDHPNVCTIHEIGEADDGQLFIAMACYEGETLRELIARGPLPLEEAIDLAQGIARGLMTAHEQEIVHRDIKPANIFITKDGLVKILDFGLAKLSRGTKVTQTGSTLGTVGYMSPEQAEGKETDHRTDLWCLGTVLFEMVTGRRPFEGDNEQAVIFAILNNVPEPATGLRTGVPMELERLIFRCLEKDPAARYQTAGDLVSDLGRMRGPSSTSAQPTMTLPPRSGARRQRPSALAWGVLASVLVVGLLIYGLNIGNVRGRLGGDDHSAPIQSLAVLPFHNLMGDAEQDYFVDGLHEALLTEMSRLGSLRVISRTSAMFYRETDKPIPEIARELNVDAIVEGSVMRVGGRVRITAQLIRGSTDEHLWAEGYDRDLKDILNLLSEVARSVAGEINIALTPRQQERLTVERTVDPAVYELALRGLHHLYKFTEQDALESRRYFEQAIAADPTFAPAHAGLAGSLLVYWITASIPSHEILPLARDAAQRAMELDPGLSESHTVLGFVEMYMGFDWDAADREFGLALDLNPNDGDALHGLSNVMIIRGEFDQAVEVVRRARQFDPFSYLRNLPVFVNLVIARRYEEAIVEIEQWRTTSNDPRVGWYWLFISHHFQGREQEAMVELRNSSTGLDPEAGPIMEKAFAESGIEAALWVCAERLAGFYRRGKIDPLSVANYFALAGDSDQTLAFMEKAYEDKAPTVHLLAQQAYDPYRADPRFRELMTKLGIQESAWEGLGGR